VRKTRLLLNRGLLTVVGAFLERLETSLNSSSHGQGGPIETVRSELFRSKQALLCSLDGGHRRRLTKVLAQRQDMARV